MRHFSDSVDPDLFSVSASVRMLFFSAQSGFFFFFLNISLSPQVDVGFVAAMCAREDIKGFVFVNPAARRRSQF